MITVDLDESQSRFLVSFPYSASLVGMIREVPGRRWDKANKTWLIPTEGFTALKLHMHPNHLSLSDSAAKWLRDKFGFIPGDTELPKLEPMVTIEDTGYKFTTTPYDHQVTAFLLAANRKYFALLMEMGTGKTKVAIDLFCFHHMKGRINRGLVLCPKAIIYTWQRELQQHGNGQLHGTPVVGGAMAKLKTVQTWQPNEILIMNYEVLLNKNILKLLLENPPHMMVLDESTRIKNPSAKTTKACWKIGARVPYKLLLTGTPITQSPLDAYGQFYFLDPKILGHLSKFAFKNEYAVMGGFQDRQVVSYKNLDRLKKKIHAYSYRVLKTECLDLPDKVYETRYFDLPPKQANAYSQMAETSLLMLDELEPFHDEPSTNELECMIAGQMVPTRGRIVAAPIVLTQLMRLQQITGGYIGTDDGEVDLPTNEKLKICMEILDEIVSAGNKCIVWSRFKHDIRAVAQELAKIGVGHTILWGATKDRQGVIDEFQEDARCKVFLGQIQTGGMGITLTAATFVIYFSNSFSLQDRLQSEDRAHRIGQTSKVTYIDIVARNTIDEMVLEAIKGKKNLADYITGDNLARIL